MQCSGRLAAGIASSAMFTSTAAICVMRFITLSDIAAILWPTRSKHHDLCHARL